MRRGVRASQLHGGFKPVYYFYRLALALLSASAASFEELPPVPERRA